MAYLRLIAPPDPAGPPVLTYLVTMDSWGGDKGGRYFAIKLGLLLALAACVALPVKLWRELSAHRLRGSVVARELHEVTETQPTSPRGSDDSEKKFVGDGAL